MQRLLEVERSESETVVTAEDRCVLGETQRSMGEVVECCGFLFSGGGGGGDGKDSSALDGAGDRSSAGGAVEAHGELDLLRLLRHIEQQVTVVVALEDDRTGQSIGECVVALSCDERTVECFEDTGVSIVSAGDLVMLEDAGIGLTLNVELIRAVLWEEAAVAAAEDAAPGLVLRIGFPLVPNQRGLPPAHRTHWVCAASSVAEDPESSTAVGTFPVATSVARIECERVDSDWLAFLQHPLPVTCDVEWPARE